jgi:flagellar motility protein MotE (MotC chaperone)
MAQATDKQISYIKDLIDGLQWDWSSEIVCAIADDIAPDYDSLTVQDASKVINSLKSDTIINLLRRTDVMGLLGMTRTLQLLDDMGKGARFMIQRQIFGAEIASKYPEQAAVLEAWLAETRDDDELTDDEAQQVTESIIKSSYEYFGFEVDDEAVRDHAKARMAQTKKLQASDDMPDSLKTIYDIRRLSQSQTAEERAEYEENDLIQDIMAVREELGIANRTREIYPGLLYQNGKFDGRFISVRR